MYVIIEMQTNGTTTALTTPLTRSSLDEAESVYHQILASAAISQVQKHTALIVDEVGNTVEKKCFYHGTTPPEE